MHTQEMSSTSQTVEPAPENPYNELWPQSTSLAFLKLSELRMNSPSPIINGATPSAFLSSDQAYQARIGRYMLVGGTSVFIWDILLHIHADRRLVKQPIGLATCTYFFSRLATLYITLMGTIFVTAPIGIRRCSTFLKIVDAGYPFSLGASSLLFLFRVRAVYAGNRYITIIFLALWLATVAGATTVPFANQGGNIGPTEYCIHTLLAPYAGAAGIIPVVNDTAVFIAISYRLMQNTYYDYREEHIPRRIHSMWSGRYLYNFSRAVLKDGQEYYLITVMSNFLTLFMVYVHDGVSPTYHSMFTVPNLVVTNCLASRVFRNAKLGIIRELSDELSELTGHRSTLTSHRGNVALIPLSSMPQRPELSVPSTKPHILEVAKTVDHVTAVDYSPGKSDCLGSVSSKN